MSAPDDGVERLFVYGDVWGGEHEYNAQPPHYRLVPRSTDPTGCTATIRNGHVTISHGGSCRAEHDANECQVVTLYAGLGNSEPYRTIDLTPSPVERARDTIERVRKGIADTLGDDGFGL